MTHSLRATEHDPHVPRRDLTLWPAIDILDGKTVRLQGGQFGTETTYHDDPLDAARRWVGAGARALHVVDLDGARDGVPANLERLRRIAAAVEVPIQFGGGLRSASAVEQALSAGASRVVLGTAAFRDPGLLDTALAKHGERVVISLDMRGGRLAGAGWTEDTGFSVEEAAQRLISQGVRHFVYSSIDRDGMLAGPDLDGARRVAALVQGSLIYSGGVSSLADLERLASLEQPALTGVIVGKALYEGRFTVSEGQAVLDRPTKAQDRCITSA